MSYPLENLGPERFQYLCQALIAREYPKVQCLPVAQPDGGRDAISFYSEDESDKFIVFQVKFARNPFADTDPHKWLVAIMEDELEKVHKLIGGGASQYLLVTNIPGTGHLNSGSIDKLNALMSEVLGLPSQCWWRNDIERRLDDAWSLKWAYPEIMTGPDFLRWIAETGFAEHRERRSGALRAFLRTQYQMDEEVRFKQVELQNKLLDLFIDVPISFRGPFVDMKQIRNFFRRRRQPRFSTLAGIAEPSEVLEVDRMYEEEGPVAVHDEEFEAASLFLSDAAQNALPRTVVEGAPGQGKSTIAQYVCQVHRMRLLREDEVLNSVAPTHRESPVRLPIKVDLRDFATWMAKKDPFNVQDPISTPKNWHTSLESFLSALISHHSGGMAFSPDDLLAVMRISSVLLVFDGLDEVADITRRKEVVEEIVKGVARIEENAASLQVIITSRPAAFANSPGMPQSQYIYLQLLSLNRPLIMNYAERWLSARKLDARESSEFRKVLKEKLDQPHLRDLARNPMQLAILLSLLLIRGPSLPDKRTALYDYYMDLFFSREAEKSRIVREHLDLLINIHRYLAWVLHSEAELGNSPARITQDRLQNMLKDYLSREGHDTGLLDELFTGMVERVVALVSRVEGTFEFEVQPLREYFAACHLYYTAPQSSPGKEKPGSKPDRFDAIARNFYWLNVTRFYAGCYSKGELPSLCERLQDLRNEQGFNSTGYPRILAATLLADWVFTQNPKSVQQMTDLVLDGIGFRYLIEQPNPRRRRVGTSIGLVLPPKCGKEELIQRGFTILQQRPPADFQDDVIGVLRAHIESPREITDKWIESFRNSCSPVDRLHWVGVGQDLGVISELPLQELKPLLAEFSPSYVVGVMLDARRLDYLESSEQLFNESVSQVLDRGGAAGLTPKEKFSVLDLLSIALAPNRYTLAFRNRYPIPMNSLFADRGWVAELRIDPQTTHTESYSSHKSCLDVSHVADVESNRTAREWATGIGPWDRITESARSLWGERWTLSVFAATASGIRSSSEKCQDSEDLFDVSRSLCRRARYARLKSGVPSWWKRQFQEVTNTNDVLLVSLLCATWATTNTLVALLDTVEDALKGLPSWEWIRLRSAVRRVKHSAKFDDDGGDRIDVAKLPENLSERLVGLLALRADEESRHRLYSRYLTTSSSKDFSTLELIAEVALDRQRFETSRWNPDLEAIQKCYESGFSFGQWSHERKMHREGISSAIAARIMASADKYPGFLMRIAENRCRREVEANIVPVTQVAEQHGWFV